MPREKRLSSRLDTLLDAIFEPHSDPFSLYWEVAAELEPGNNAPAQKKIRRTLEARSEIETEGALLVACVLHLTGFPAQRILHFLSLYIRSTVSLSQFELAVTTIFIGDPPVPQSLLYDLTQYTYLEKRLLLRKGLEISARLKDTLSPEVLLFLYLLSLRDDLSNENVQLISLVMNNCFPALEVRTRLGGASLEEYGELARALKAAGRRSLSADTLRGARTPEPPPRSFDRDSASHFLDKYFSDEALAQTHTRAVKPLQKPARPISAKNPPRPELTRGAPGAAPVKKRAVAERGQAAAEAPGGSAAVPARETGGEVSPLIVRQASSAPAARAAPVAPRPAAVDLPSSPARRARSAGSEDIAPAPARGRHQRGPAPGERTTGRRKAASQGGMLLFFRMVPFCIALLAVAVVPILESRAVAASSQASAYIPAAPAQQATTPAPAFSAAQQATTPAPAPSPAPAAPAVTKYVVQRGDSVWKIYQSLGRETGDGKSWQQFLSTTRALNRLEDPDTILPWKVLNIAPAE